MNIRNLKLKHITILNCSKENEILSCTLEKHVQDLQAENYNMLMSKIKEDINKWRDILCSWIGRLNLVKMSILKSSCRFNKVHIKITAGFFL